MGAVTQGSCSSTINCNQLQSIAFPWPHILLKFVCVEVYSTVNGVLTFTVLCVQAVTVLVWISLTSWM